MRVHPIAPRKRNIASFRYAAGGNLLGQKKLRRLPHIFSKVLELPFASDADVAVSEGPTWLRFSAATDGLGAAGVRAHAVEIHPGVMKVVIRNGGGGGDGDGGGVGFLEEEEEMALDRWRFRLPEQTRPRLATAEYIDGELVVTVPKGVGDGEDHDGDADADDGGFPGLGHLVLVQ